MNDHEKTKAQLLAELEGLRQRVDGLEVQLARSQLAEADQRKIRQAEDDRRRAVEALRESEEWFQAFMNNSPSAAWMKDEQGRYVYLNRSYEHLIGMRLVDWRGKTDFDLWPVEIAEQFWKNDQAVLASHRLVEVMEETIDSNGERYYWRCFKFPFQDAQGKGYIGGVGIDITGQRRTEEALQKFNNELERRVEERTAELTKANELLQAEVEQRRRAEQALQESDQRMQMALEVSRSFAFEWDAATDRVLRSDSCCAILGLSGEEARHDTAQEFFQRVHPDGRDRFVRIVGELRPSADTYHTEYRANRGDGTTVLLEESARGFFDSDGVLCRVVGVTTDITKRKQTEDNLKAEQQALRRMVMASDHERRLITYELHDGPVQQLLGALMLFQSPALHKVWESAEAEAVYRDGMAALLHGSLELRRVMSSLRTPILETFGLAEAIGDVVSQLQSAPGAPGIEYRPVVPFKRLEPTLENALFRIAQEAMTNACRHSKSQKVQVELTQKDDDITLEIRDWGIGFDSHTVAANRFGLEGIRERARILGGHLDITSEIGQGTVVRVTFPAIEAASDE